MCKIAALLNPTERRIIATYHSTLTTHHSPLDHSPSTDFLSLFFCSRLNLRGRFSHSLQRLSLDLRRMIVVEAEEHTSEGGAS